MGQGGVRLGAILALGASLASAGCASRSYLPVDDAGRRTAPPPTTPALSPANPAPATPTPPPPPRDSCGAADLAYLVGKPKTEIPIPVDLTKRRVVCETCPRTMDMREDRQTILYDDKTNQVTSVTCG